MGYINEYQIPESTKMEERAWMLTLWKKILDEAYNDPVLSWVYEIPGIFDQGVDQENLFRYDYSKNWKLEAYLSRGQDVKFTVPKSGRMIINKVITIEESELY